MTNKLERLEVGTKKSKKNNSSQPQYDPAKIGGALTSIFSALDNIRPERQKHMLESLRAGILAGKVDGVTDSYMFNALDGARQEIFGTVMGIFSGSDETGSDNTVMQSTALDAIDARVSALSSSITNVSNVAALPMAYALLHEADSVRFPSLEELQIQFFTATVRTFPSHLELANTFSRVYRLKFGDAVHLSWTVINAEPSLRVVDVLNARHYFRKG